MDFRYSDPERGFDRARVKGVVAKLTRVADPTASTALEVVAGGKLYQARIAQGRAPATAVPGWGLKAHQPHVVVWQQPTPTRSWARQ